MTPLTDTQVAGLKADIAAATAAAGGVVSAVDPALAPFVMIGQAVAGSLPGLAQDVQNLIAGAAPTAAQEKALQTDITNLENPAGL